ncbi:hypothetical protein Vafri_14808 [Volvox africanus]|uniref:Uncharacterized protein n=1 Tax=Volvox africanus TaxID=51714 RepID=A0A8J4F4V0_9CHLO|nr:hypothetical protein Vafri_14808 [Volvox africanus]
MCFINQCCVVRSRGIQQYAAAYCYYVTDLVPSSLSIGMASLCPEGLAGRQRRCQLLCCGGAGDWSMQRQATLVPCAQRTAHSAREECSFHGFQCRRGSL